MVSKVGATVENELGFCEHLLPGAEPSSEGIEVSRFLEIYCANDLRSMRAFVSGQGEFVMVL